MSTPQVSQLAKSQDRIRYEEIMSYPCQPSLRCSKLVAIYEHMENFYNGHPYTVSDFRCAKQAFDEEFWRHAPAELKYWKERIMQDPINHKSTTRYDILLKLYKFQIQNPLYRFPDNLDEKIAEFKRVCESVGQNSWGNFE